MYTSYSRDAQNTHTQVRRLEKSLSPFSLFSLLLFIACFEWMVYLGLVSHCPTLKRNPNNNLMTHASPLAVVQYTY